MKRWNSFVPSVNNEGIFTQTLWRADFGRTIIGISRVFLQKCQQDVFLNDDREVTQVTAQCGSDMPIEYRQPR
jgi:hypothetical protein